MSKKEPADDYEKVKCSICNIIMNADDFAEHAVDMHEDDVLDLISDDDIIDNNRNTIFTFLVLCKQWYNTR